MLYRYSEATNAWRQKAEAKKKEREDAVDAAVAAAAAEAEAKAAASSGYQEEAPQLTMQVAHLHTEKVKLEHR